MKNFVKPGLLAGVLAAGLVGPGAHAQGLTPNGPWLNDNQQVRLESLKSYDELVTTLEGIAASGKGAKLVYPSVRSNTLRAIPAMEIGSGPVKVLLVAQQHGNELITASSAVAVIRTLTNNSATSKAIREKLTVVVVPRVNVDGFDGVDENGDPIRDTRGRVPPWRQNFDTSFTTGQLPPFYASGRGYDINRYHPYLPDCPNDNPNSGSAASCGQIGSADENPVPEAVAVRQLFDRYDPVVVMDMHHQGTYSDADGDMVTGSTLWPTAAATAKALEDIDMNAEERFAQGAGMGKRAVSVLVEALRRYGFANITRYNGGAEPGISRNAYGLLGAGSVLVELRGGIGQKSSGYIGRIGYAAMMSVVEKLASDPTLSTVGTAAADGLEPHGTPISGEDEEDEDHGSEPHGNE